MSYRESGVIRDLYVSSSQMVGIEYILLHAQEPILFIIRKQQRQSPAQVIPLADYYIIAGVIYQAPDLGSVINSRVVCLYPPACCLPSLPSVLDRVALDSPCVWRWPWTPDPPVSIFQVLRLQMHASTLSFFHILWTLKQISNWDTLLWESSRRSSTLCYLV